MGTLLDDDLDSQVLGIADELSAAFLAELPEGVATPEMRDALGGLQLTFLQRVVRLVRHE